MPVGEGLETTGFIQKGAGCLRKSGMVFFQGKAGLLLEKGLDDMLIFLWFDAADRVDHSAARLYKGCKVMQKEKLFLLAAQNFFI